MKEITADFWEVWINYDFVCIPTNGCVKKDGCAVMGAGLAKEARERWPGIDLALGTNIKVFGIGVTAIHWLEIGAKEIDIYAFPTKYHWKEKSSLELIEKSAKELVEKVEGFIVDGGWKVLLPRPGTGYGRLSWEKEVKPILAPILDDRVTVIGRV